MWFPPWPWNGGPRTTLSVGTQSELVSNLSCGFNGPNEVPPVRGVVRSKHIKNLLQWLVVVVVSEDSFPNLGSSFRIQCENPILKLNNSRYGQNKSDYLCIIIPIKKERVFFLC